jgi:outer membrane lipoprotein-sorting protein
MSSGSAGERKIGKKSRIVAIVAALVVSGISSYWMFAASAHSSHQASSRQGITLQYGAAAPTGLAELFAKVSSMTVEFNFTDTDGATTTHLMTYTVRGDTTMSDGSAALVVNLVGLTTTPGRGSDNYNVSMYVDPSSGQILQVSMDNETWTGSSAEAELSAFSFFLGNCWLSQMNSTSVRPAGAEQEASLGATAMQIQPYSGATSQYQNWSVDVGSLGGMSIVVATSYASAGGSASFRILSLAPAAS